MQQEQRTRLLRRMMLAINRIDGAYYLFARRRGIHENTLALLYALDDGTPHSQKQVCEEWLIPKTTIHTIGRQLEGEGLLTLQAGEHGREKTICLTPAGVTYAREILQDVYAAENAAIDAALEQFSPDFVQALEHFTDELCARFESRPGAQPKE